MDHSKDVVTEIIPPSPHWGGSSGKWDDWSTPTNPQNTETKKEEWFDELFEEGKKKEVVDAPAPVIEFKLSSETIWANVSDSIGDSEKSDNSSVSFDIGGDMNFDIGGDMTSPSEISPTWSFIQNSSPLDPLWASISENNSMTPQAADDSNISVDAIASVEVTPEITPSFADTQDTGNNKETDSALFSLLNDDASTVWSVTPDVSVAEIVPASISGDTSFISPLGNSSPTTESIITSETVAVSESKKEEDSSIFGTTISPLIATEVSPIELDEDIHSDTTSPTTSKLKSKLEEFIDELKTLEIEDQEVKIKKRQQFEMFRVRAQEIKAEYDMRIRALELEEKALENQIAAMDNEKTQIKDVIRAFKLELEKA